MELPRCPNHQRFATCERSDVILDLEKTDPAAGFWSFFCKTCRLTFVQTKPTTKQAARFNLEKERLERVRRGLRSRDARPLYFT